MWSVMVTGRGIDIHISVGDYAIDISVDLKSYTHHTLEKSTEGCYVAAKSVLPRWHHCSIKVWLDKDNRNYLWRRKNGYGYLVNIVALVTCIIRSYICLYICNVKNQLGKAKVYIYTYYRYAKFLKSIAMGGGTCSEKGGAPDVRCGILVSPLSC